MRDRIEITKEILDSARDYVPEREKREFVDRTAERVFDRIQVRNGETAYPDMYMVNASLRARYLTGALAALYLRIPFGHDEVDEFLMAEGERDLWGESHVLRQLEGLKRQSDTRLKAIDILADYRDLAHRLDEKIRSVMAVQNDPVIRQSQMEANAVKELPEVLKALEAYTGAKGGAGSAGSGKYPVEFSGKFTENR